MNQNTVSAVERIADRIDTLCRFRLSDAPSEAVQRGAVDDIRAHCRELEVLMAEARAARSLFVSYSFIADDGRHGDGNATLQDGGVPAGKEDVRVLEERLAAIVEGKLGVTATVTLLNWLVL